MSISRYEGVWVNGGKPPHEEGCLLGLRRLVVWLILTDVSEELTAYIIRVTRLQDTASEKTALRVVVALSI